MKEICIYINMHMSNIYQVRYTCIKNANLYLSELIKIPESFIINIPEKH